MSRRSRAAALFGPALVLAALASIARAAGPPASPARADDTVGTAAPDSVPTPHYVVREPIRVAADPLAPGQTPLRAADWEHGRAASLAEAVLDLPAVAGVRRAGGAVEPVVRGLGWERVPTRVGGVCIAGACPSRMDPPATYFAAHLATAVTVVTGIPSVTIGPGTLGGAVEIRPDWERPPGSGRSLAVRGDESWDSAGDAWRSGGVMEGGTDRLDLRVSGEYARRGDYESPRGAIVPAGRESRGASASLGGRPGAGQRAWTTWREVREENVDFPALPMDTESSELHLLNAGWSLRPAGVVDRVEVTGGWASIDHVMSNAAKPNRATLEARTPSTATSGAAGVSVSARGPGGATWRSGAQLSRVDRDAVRTRRVVATGATFTDHLWPDVSQAVGGGYLEAERGTAGARLGWRVGARVDVVESRARALDDPALGGGTVADGFVRFHGAGADAADRTETIGAATALLRSRLGGATGAHVGFGVVERAAGLTERWFAFGPAPGGYQVGNPGLDAERKWSVELGIARRGARLVAEATGWWHRVDDYVLPAVVAREDVNGDGITDVVRSFRNVRADLAGLEAACRWRPAAGWIVPAQIAFVRGVNRTDGDADLPEMPPLAGRVALRRELAPGAAWVEAETRFAARQPFVDATFPEDRTPAWGTVAIRGAVSVVERVRLHVAIENLLDAEWHDHLTREALLPVGDLAAGDEVPAPGRSVTASLRAAW